MLVLMGVLLASTSVPEESAKPRPGRGPGPAPSTSIQTLQSLQSIAPEQLLALLPAIVQTLNLAIYDPVLAANLVPDLWIESLVTGAVAVEAEVATQLTRKDPPRSWPIGPWTDASSMIGTIQAADPVAVAALYRALRPRMKGQCALLGLTLRECEQSIRNSMRRLSDPAVRARASGHPKASVTPTQRELARLGEPVVVALHGQLQTLGKNLFGSPAKQGT